MLKVKIGDVVDSMAALGELSALPLPASSAFSVARVVRALKDPLLSYEAARTALLQRVGTPMEGEEGKFKINDLETWQTELAQLRMQTVEVPAVKLQCADFKDVPIDAKSLLTLEWLVDM